MERGWVRVGLLRDKQHETHIVKKGTLRLRKSEVNFIFLDQNLIEIYPDKWGSGTCNSTRIQFH